MTWPVRNFIADRLIHMDSSVCMPKSPTGSPLKALSWASQTTARAGVATTAVRLSPACLMLKRQGIKLDRKKLNRLYKEERLTVRKRGGRKRAPGRLGAQVRGGRAGRVCVLMALADPLSLEYIPPFN